MGARQAGGMCNCFGGPRDCAQKWGACAFTHAFVPGGAKASWAQCRASLAHERPPILPPCCARGQNGPGFGGAQNGAKTTLSPKGSSLRLLAFDLWSKACFDWGPRPPIERPPKTVRLDASCANVGTQAACARSAGASMHDRCPPWAQGGSLPLGEMECCASASAKPSRSSRLMSSMIMSSFSLASSSSCSSANVAVCDYAQP